MARGIGTLSSKGWATTPESRLDKAITYYLSLNYSQTTRYRGSVRSLQYAMHKAGDSMNTLTDIVQRDLEFIYGNNFPEGVEVIVNAVPINGNDARYDLRISVVVVEDGKQYDLATTLSKIDSTYVRVFDVGTGNAV